MRAFNFAGGLPTRYRVFPPRWKRPSVSLFSNYRGLTHERTWHQSRCDGWEWLKGRCRRRDVTTLRTGDADLRFYITTVQDGWRKSAFLIGEISPTRCNDYVFYSQWLYSTCFGWQSHPSSGVQCCIWPQVRLSPETCRVKPLRIKKRNCCILLDLFHQYKAWCTEPQILNSAFLTRACFPCTIHLIMRYIGPVSEWSCWRMFIETWPHSELNFRYRASSI